MNLIHRILVCGFAAAGLAALGSCGRAAPAPPLEAQTTGAVDLPGLAGPVTVVRDRHGVPHISAGSTADLFMAQGFIQAQDRLFQMDLWRRSSQGRLAEVLGSNFIERDAMTRRTAYRGDDAAEWASYGPEARAIAEAFVRGVNAWVVKARDQRPIEYRLAGWTPELWRADDLLARADAFTLGGDAVGDVFRARLVAEVGLARARALLPRQAAALERLPAGLDPKATSYVVAESLQAIGAPGFFLGLAAPLPARAAAASGAGSNAWVVGASRTGTGRPIVASDPHRLLSHPSTFYLIHLKAPGWNVVGAAAPWLPGVVIGHNDHVAWGLTSWEADTQDLFVERTDPADPARVLARDGPVPIGTGRGALRVKGRSAFVRYDTQTTPNGVVVASDRGGHRAFVLRWTGTEPGTAAFLGALALDRAQSAGEFRDALRRWKSPGALFVYADDQGAAGYQAAALLPQRGGCAGAVPAPAWTGECDWRGWVAFDDLPHGDVAPDGWFAHANTPLPSARGGTPVAGRWAAPDRLERTGQRIGSTLPFGVEASAALQHDSWSARAARLVPLLASVHGSGDEVEAGRQTLLAWDRRLAPDSAAAGLYLRWVGHLQAGLVAGRLSADLGRQAIERDLVPVVSALTEPTRAWFDGVPVRARDALLLSALEAAVRNGSAPRTVLFHHPLSVSQAARALFDIGPFPRGGGIDAVMFAGGATPETQIGAGFAAVIDVGAWDSSLVINAPGQSGSPSSSHFGDLAQVWAGGGYVPMWFGDDALTGGAEASLTLRPAAHGGRSR